MNLEQILNALVNVQAEDDLPLVGLEAAKANWPLFYPELIKIMDEFIANPKAVTPERQNILFYGTWLLAELKYTPALDKVLELFACQDTFLTPIESVFGDALTELVPSLFYILANGNPEVLSDFVLGDHFAMYSKGSAIEVVFAQYEAGIVSKTELTDYVSLWQTSFLASPGMTSSFLLSVLATSCIDYQLDSFKNEFNALCSKNVFDEDRASLDEIKAWASIDGGKLLEAGLIQEDFNVVESLTYWGIQKPDHEEKSAQVEADIAQIMSENGLLDNIMYDEQFILENSVPVTSLAKVGRNDPCPCGSGKKYKKCYLH
ncbi:DUF1186 domain-containing protein [Catenovulum adriaticum]|uniref:DUF1186 domain-containing protein n=1 Tax=Catenovulum adriaticum TaxID=2984846 RepID=UPI002DD69A95|nr:DUF1186 domain-containing protein [Catenovulum sp. TS8]